MVDQCPISNDDDDGGDDDSDNGSDDDDVGVNDDRNDDGNDDHYDYDDRLVGRRPGDVASCFASAEKVILLLSFP